MSKADARVLAGYLIDHLYVKARLEGLDLEQLLTDRGAQVLDTAAAIGGDPTYVRAEEIAFHRQRLHAENKVAQV